MSTCSHFLGGRGSSYAGLIPKEKVLDLQHVTPCMQGHVWKSISCSRKVRHLYLHCVCGLCLVLLHVAMCRGQLIHAVDQL